MKKLLLLSALSLVILQSTAQNFSVYAAKDMTKTSIAEAAALLSKADVVFVGEEHNDSLAHVLQTQLFQALHAIKQQDLALSMEMFETDCQMVLNEYLAGLIREDQLLKDGRGWPNYKDYRPMVEFAKENKLAVLAANAPRRYVNLVARRSMQSLDSLGKDAKKWLAPLPFDTLSGAYAAKFSALMGGHGRPAIYHSQSLWDATMSYSIYRFAKKNKRKLVYHICGRFHSDEKLGTVAQLKKRNKRLEIATVSCIPYATAKEMTKEALAAIADFVVITNEP